MHPIIRQTLEQEIDLLDDVILYGQWREAVAHLTTGQSDDASAACYDFAEIAEEEMARRGITFDPDWEL